MTLKGAGTFIIDNRTVVHRFIKNKVSAFTLIGERTVHNGKTAVFLFKIIPTAFISRLFGWMARIPLPGLILNPVIRWYCARFGVRTDEIPEGERFGSFDRFFTRRLKEGARTIDPMPKSVVSPVDAKIDFFGRIDGTTLLQAKGMEYSLADLVPCEYHRHFTGGDFVTLYLSPADYHRIHSPVSGHIEGYCAVPGKLYTVQEFLVKEIKGLFALNERLLSFIKTDRGRIAVCKIGAMNVGRISLSYAGIQTNTTFRKKTEYFYEEQRMPAVAKGAEIGIFHLGSTVIVLFEKGTVKLEKLVRGDYVQLGSVIARFI